jgi:N-methylhydantoinase A
LAEYRHDVASSFIASLDSLDRAQVAQEYAKLERRLSSVLVSEGIAPEGALFHAEMDLQYVDEDESLTLEYPSVADDGAIAGLQARFKREHSAAYGFTRDSAVEVVRLRMRATATTGAADMTKLLREGYARKGPKVGVTRSAYFGRDRGSVDAEVCTRADLHSGRSYGPLLLDEPDSTVMVPPGWAARIDEWANVVLEKLR